MDVGIHPTWTDRNGVYVAGRHGNAGSCEGFNWYESFEISTENRCQRCQGIYVAVQISADLFNSNYLETGHGLLNLQQIGRHALISSHVFPVDLTCYQQ